MHDPLEELLAPPAPVQPPDLYAHILTGLRRRRRLRQLGGMASLLAAFTAGLLTALCAVPPERQWQQARLPIAPPIEVSTLSPTALEWQALDHPDQAAATLRQAGDGYLDQADLGNATRCYGNALDESPASLDLSAEDSWLLMTIKLARKKEALACPPSASSP